MPKMGGVFTAGCSLRHPRSLLPAHCLVATLNPCLYLEMVIPIRTPSSQQLPQARHRIRRKEQNSAALILRNMHSLMRPDALEFFGGNSQDHMPEHDATERQPASNVPAISNTITVGNFERASVEPCAATEQQRNTRKQQANGATRRSPADLGELESIHVRSVVSDARMAREVRSNEEGYAQRAQRYHERCNGQTQHQHLSRGGFTQAGCNAL
jgi:hypothetical protein